MCALTKDSVECIGYVGNTNFNFKHNLLYHICVYIYYLNIGIVMNFKFIIRLKDTLIYFGGVVLMFIHFFGHNPSSLCLLMNFVMDIV